MRETFRPVLPRRTYSMIAAQTERSLSSLFDLDQLDVEEQCGVWRDRTAGAALSVPELGRDNQRALAADFHPGDALVPAADHLPATQLERERLAMVLRAVELLPVLVGGLRVVQPTGVVHRHLMPALRFSARADLAVGHLQTR